jgi:ribosomal protein S18 acetylase RimI-like enzyme
MTAARKPVRVRPGTVDDIPFLLQLGDELKGGRPVTPQRLTEAITGAINDPDRQLMLAVGGRDGESEEPLGMALLTLGSANPLLDIPAVHISHTIVSSRHRRRGAGKALMAAAAAFAEERGIDQLMISLDPGSRESARYFARLGFVPLAVRRTAPVALVRRKLSASAPRLRA